MRNRFPLNGTADSHQWGFDPGCSRIGAIIDGRFGGCKPFFQLLLFGLLPRSGFGADARNGIFFTRMAGSRSPAKRNDRRRWQAADAQPAVLYEEGSGDRLRYVRPLALTRCERVAAFSFAGLVDL
jgi:hypothetical protein